MGDAFNRADWFAVALSGGVPRETAHPTALWDQELVVWRDALGKPHVWQDRCAHRGTRLSLGFVRGDSLSCLYHGWCYSGEGACTRIPAHPGLTPPGAVRAVMLAHEEQGGVIWSRLDEGGASPPALPEDVIPVRSIVCDVALSRIIGALAVPLLPFAGRVRRDGAVLSVQSETDGVALHLALQPASEEKTVLHILASSPRTGDRVSIQRDYAHWAERFRWSVENSA